MFKRVVLGLSVSLLALILAGCWPMPNRISVSPDGNLIAISMPDETRGFYEAFPTMSRIWLIERATGRVESVLADGGSLSWATWSPDGQELLYEESEGLTLQRLSAFAERWRLVIVNRKNGERTELLRGTNGLLWGPTFSPDGKRIAYYRGEANEKTGLYVFDRASGQEKLLKTVQDAEGLYYAPYGPGPSWSPDGKALLLVRVVRLLPENNLPKLEELAPETFRILQGRMVLVDVSCGCEVVLAQGYFPLMPTPLFIASSADGTRLYFNAYSEGFSIHAREKVGLYELNTETGERQALYDGPGMALAPALSPDEQKLTFTVIRLADSTLQADLHIKDLSTLDPPRQLTQDGRSGFGFWLSDQELGSLRLVQSEQPTGELWIKNLETGEERNLTPLLAVQQSVAQLSLRVAALSEAIQKDEIASSRQALEQLQKQIQTLTEQIAPLASTLEGLAQKFDSQMAQHLEQLQKQIQTPTEQIAQLTQDLKGLQGKADELDKKVEALRERQILILWQLLLVLLASTVFIVWMIRRALRRLAQQLTFPPQ